MNEDLHIEKAAQLADKQGAENLATERAKMFVASALASTKAEKSSWIHRFFVQRPAVAWCGTAFALAACVAAAVVLFHPSSGDDNGVLPGYGVPGHLQENQSIHANTDLADTTLTVSSDTLVIDAIVKTE